MHLVSVDLPPHADGGVASWTHDLALALQAEGAPLQVWTRSARAGLPNEPGYYPVHRMFGRSWGAHQAIWAAAQVGPALRRGDQLLCSTWPVARWLAPLAARRGVAVGVAVHGSELTTLRTAPPGLRAVLRSARRVFAVSRFLAGCLESLGGRAEVLPVPLPALPAREGPGQGLALLGRLTPLKGVDRGLRLARALGWRALVVGEGPEGAALRALARELGVEAEFTGRLPRAQALARVREAAACALLSRAGPGGLGAEGLGICLLEAAAQGVPALGSATGGVPEAVGPGLVLADPDDAEGSAAQLRAWLQGGARGAEARAWVQRVHGGARAARAVLEALA